MAFRSAKHIDAKRCTFNDIGGDQINNFNIWVDRLSFGALVRRSLPGAQGKELDSYECWKLTIQWGGATVGEGRAGDQWDAFEAAAEAATENLKCPHGKKVPIHTLLPPSLFYFQQFWKSTIQMGGATVGKGRARGQPDAFVAALMEFKEYLRYYRIKKADFRVFFSTSLTVYCTKCDKATSVRVLVSVRLRW